MLCGVMLCIMWLCLCVRACVCVCVYFMYAVFAMVQSSAGTPSSFSLCLPSYSFGPWLPGLKWCQPDLVFTHVKRTLPNVEAQIKKGGTIIQNIQIAIEHKATLKYGATSIMQ